MISKTLSYCCITAKLGEGGMDEVYRARTILNGDGGRPDCARKLARGIFAE